jgi:hypothetical protein
MEEKKSTYHKTEKLKVQQRDIQIFQFLDRIGYANIEQITIAINGEFGENQKAALLRRLYILRRFNYIRVYSTHLGNYYGLDKKSKLTNALIDTIKLDQLEHHNFLTDLFFYVQNQPDVLSEREVIIRYKIVGKKGKIPDMVIGNWIIEYERSSKSATDSLDLVTHWTVEKGKNLCIIYATEEIKNRYMKVINPNVKLFSQKDYKLILDVIKNEIDPQSVENSQSANLSETKIVEIMQENGTLKKVKKFGNFIFPTFDDEKN